MKAKSLYLVFLFLSFSCTHPKLDNDDLILWGNPIQDYIESATLIFTDFEKGISSLEVFEDVLFIGYGDASVNVGSEFPIEFRTLKSLDQKKPDKIKVLGYDQGAAQRSEYDTGEEKIIKFARIDNNLWQPGYDSNTQDELYTQSLPGEKKLIQGNVFKLQRFDGEFVFKKYRNILGGEHVIDIDLFKDRIFAVGSGANNREEWESGFVYRYIWESNDGGKNFKIFHRNTFDIENYGDTRFRALLSMEDKLFVFGYINPKPYNSSIIPINKIIDKSLTISDNLSILKNQLIWNTFPLGETSGLAVSDFAVEAKKTFFISSKGIEDLSNWRNNNVIGLSGMNKTQSIVLLEKDDISSVYIIENNDPNNLKKIISTDFLACSIAYWKKHIVIGSCTGDLYLLKYYPKL